MSQLLGMRLDEGGDTAHLAITPAVRALVSPSTTAAGPFANANANGNADRCSGASGRAGSVALTIGRSASGGMTSVQGEVRCCLLCSFFVDVVVF